MPESIQAPSTALNAHCKRKSRKMLDNEIGKKEGFLKGLCNSQYSQTVQRDRVPPCWNKLNLVVWQMRWLFPPKHRRCLLWLGTD